MLTNSLRQARSLVAVGVSPRAVRKISVYFSFDPFRDTGNSGRLPRGAGWAQRRKVCLRFQDEAETASRVVGSIFYCFGKLAFAFTSSICSVCLWEWAEINRIH